MPYLCCLLKEGMGTDQELQLLLLVEGNLH